MQIDVFKLECIMCGTKDTRPAHECHEMQFCKQCGSLMVLDEITVQHWTKAQADAWAMQHPSEV